MTKLSLRMEGRAVLVTGAANGIGRAYCAGLLEAGAELVVGVDIDEEGLSTLGAELPAGGGRFVAVPVDVTNEDALVALRDRLDGEFGRLDGLVNNAAVEGAPTPTPLVELSAEAYDRVMAVNAKAMWLTVRTFLPLLTRSSSASIVNQGSVGAFLATAAFLPYVTSKNAIFGITKTLARELGDRGIRVNCIAPGPVATEKLKAAITAEVIDGLVANQCIKRIQDPSDLVGPLLFLLSDHSRFITGQTLVVDGGSVLLP